MKYIFGNLYNIIVHCASEYNPSVSLRCQEPWESKPVHYLIRAVSKGFFENFQDLAIPGVMFGKKAVAQKSGRLFSLKQS